MHDPKNLQKKPIASDDDQDDLRTQLAEMQAQMQTLLAAKTSSGGLSAEQIEAMMIRVAQISAEAQERAANPSNRQSLGKSPFSYPEGDAKRPRAFKYPMLQCGYEMELDTTSAEEIELMNAAEPGNYTFTRLDGTTDTLSVIADRAPDGSINKLHFNFNAKDRRESIPSPWRVLLRDALRIPTPEQQELAKLKAELQALKSQTVSA